MLSEELCEDFTEEFKKFDRGIWDVNHPSLSSGGMPDVNNNGGKDFRNTIQGFVANCMRRRLYEREIRAEQGFSNEITPIPPPGVPADIPVSLDDLLDDNLCNQVAKTGDDYFDAPFNVGDNDQD